MIIALIGGFFILFIIDFVTVLENKDRKVYILYFALFIIGFTINILLLLDRAPTSPAIIIDRIVKSII